MFRLLAVLALALPLAACSDDPVTPSRPGSGTYTLQRIAPGPFDVPIMIVASDLDLSDDGEYTMRYTQRVHAGDPGHEYVDAGRYVFRLPASLDLRSRTHLNQVFKGTLAGDSLVYANASGVTFVWRRN